MAVHTADIPRDDSDLKKQADPKGHSITFDHSRSGRDHRESRRIG